MSTDVEQLLKRIPLHKPSDELDTRVLDTLARGEMTADHHAADGVSTEPRPSGSGALALASSNESGDLRSSEDTAPSRSRLSADDEGAFDDRSRALPWVMFALAAAACAALAAVMWFGPGTPSDPTPDAPLVAGPSDDSPRDNNAAATSVADFNPVRIEQVWTGVQPEGVVYIDGGTPVRRYRQQTIEHVQLVDEEKNIRIEITVPREDVIVTPVDYD